VNRYLNHGTSFEIAGSAREIELENKLFSPEYQVHQEEQTRMFKHLPLKSILASNYLSKAEPYLSQLISSQNFKEIITLAHHFPGNLTSFLGFECRLGDTNTRSDWAFAISGRGGDRQVLANLFENGNLPADFSLKPEWQHITDFAKAWVDPNSILRDKIQCFWLEFDMPDPLPEILIPSVFFGPEKISQNTLTNNVSQYKWLINTALPLLKGKNLSKQMEHQLLHCIRRLPSNASIQFVGVMLSRFANGVRLYIKKLQPQQIIPYLNSLGWIDETGELATLIKELEDKADRFVIGFDVDVDGIGPKIGIECSFISNRFNHEIRWRKLLNYLVKKGICLPEKRDALLMYSGIENDEHFSGGIMKPIPSASNHIDDLLSSALIRYISHIKIIYQNGQSLEAKAYPAVRLFNSTDEPITE